MFGDNPSGWAFGRMGQIYMGRAIPFGALVAGLTADEFLLLGEAADERRCRDEIGGGIAPGSLLIHDPERAHNALVRDGGLEIEHIANVNDPVYLERMEMVKDPCS